MGARPLQAAARKMVLSGAQPKAGCQGRPWARHRAGTEPLQAGERPQPQEAAAQRTSWRWCRSPSGRCRVRSGKSSSLQKGREEGGGR